MSANPRIAFYSEYAYPLIAGRAIEFAGGAEAMVVRLARGLATRDWDVTLITCDYGQPPCERIDGVRVLRAFRPGQGLKFVRFVHPRLSLATLALMRADAEVYYVCGSGMPAGLTADVAKLRGAAFVQAIASDYDVMTAPPPEAGSTHLAWHRRALRRADHVFAQTEFQRGELERNYHVASSVLPNMMEIPAEPIDPGQDGIVLWNATYKAMKRPDWFVHLARALPQHRFVMAGIIPPPPLTREVWEQTVAAARELPHLEVHGFLPEPELVALRRQASLVVHTSPVEGFSNVLLETWAAGVPTVSCVNPDGLVTREGLGSFVESEASLVDAVRTWMADPAARRAAGARARRYAERTHAPRAVLDTLEPVLRANVEAVRRKRARR